MKKAQILSAIALAFALGVVAPVAGLANTASAVSIVDSQILSNRADINNTIAAIESKTEYQNYVAIQKAVAATTGAGAVTDSTVTATMISDLVSALQALGTVGETNYATYTAPTTGTNAAKLQTVINDAKAALAAKTEKSFTLWSNLYKAMNDTSKDTGDNQKAQAIVNAADALGMNVKEGYDAENDSLQDVKGEITASTTYGDGTTSGYGYMTGLIINGQAAIDSVNDEIAALKAALAPFADARDIADAEKSSTPIASLVALAPDMTTAGSRGKKYADLISEVNGIKAAINTSTYDGDTSANTVVVDNLKADYKAASGSDLVVSGSTATDPTNPDATVRTLTSQNGEVAVTGAFEAGVEVMAAPATTDVFGDKAYEAYDITLWKDGKQYNDFKGTAFVTIKLSKVDAAKSTVYYVDGNEKTALETTCGDKTVSFYTTHFSLYAAVEGEVAEDPSAPGTGIVSTAEGNAATTISIVAGLATALTALGAGVVAYRSARRSNK